MAAAAALPLAMAGGTVAGPVVELVKETEKDLFAAFGRPIVSMDTVETRRRKNRDETTTTHAELNAFTIGIGAVGLAAALWISGLQLGPMPKTRVVHHPAQTIEEPVVGKITIPAFDERIPYVGVGLRQRPPWSWSLFGNGNVGTSSADPAIAAAFDIVQILFGWGTGVQL
jgi:hypothetical protein